MPREIFALTDATKDTLTDNVKQIAHTWDKCVSYVYAILTSEKTDPYAPFRKLYAAAVRAGVPTFHWENDMAEIRLRAEKRKPVKTPAEVLIEKVKSDAHTDTIIISAIEDGNITDDEAKDIEAAIARERELLDSIEVLVRDRKPSGGLRVA
jgi:hypothetical protein